MPTKGTANYDASITNEKRSVRIFKDLNLNFAPNLVTNDVSKLTDIEAIKRSVRNLVQLNHYEKPFHPEIGSNIRSILFEPVTPLVADVLERNVRDVIDNFEPRAELISITANAQIDNNRYDVTIEFYLVNSPSGVETVNLFLERLR